LVVALVSPGSQRNAAITTLSMGVASAAFFRIVGEADRIPWLVVVLSLIYVGYLVRRDPLLKRRPRSKEEAFREASFAFGFTSLLMFAFGNFGTPDDPYAPLRMSVTMGLAWGVVAYRLSRGYPQNGWRLLVTLLTVGLPVTVIWVLGAKLIGG
jgi:hypothetical protein